MPSRRCWLARFSDVPCDGRLVRVHLVPKQLMRRELGRKAAYAMTDPRAWVWACGGITGGPGGHHGMLDTSRTLRVPRALLPAAVEEFAGEHGLTWWLDREYPQRLEEAA